MTGKKCTPAEDDPGTPDQVRCDGSSGIEAMLKNAHEASHFLKALSHETRLVLLCLLAEGERSVTDLENILELRQPAVSQQLARLRLDGLVGTRRDGKAIYYSLANDEIRRAIKAVYDVFCKERPGTKGLHPWQN